MLRTAYFFLAAALPLAGAGFRAAAVKVDITPSSPQWLMGYNARQSDGVHDPIYHRVIAIEAGAVRFFLVASDLCLFSPGVYDDVTAELEKQTGIPRQSVWWSVTHTHAAPEVGAPGIYKTLLGRSDHEWNRDYAAQVSKALIDAVRTARDHLEPARIGFGATISMANINRRGRDPEGHISLGLNPDGPVDRQVNLIRLERASGGLMALIMNYPMHGTVMSGQNLKISGDGPGTVSAWLEQKLGATVLYVNGAAGNIAPIYSVYPDPRSSHLSEFNVLLGERVLQAAQSMGPATADVGMAFGEKVVETPRKDGLDWPAELSAYNKEGPQPRVRLPIRFLRINDALLWSAPVEMFCEIAMKVRGRSPFDHTFYFGYTNGWFGYLPTAQAFAEGGYEPRTSPFTAAAEKDVADGVTAFIAGFPRRSEEGK
jgi:hypothetical protein